MNQNFLLQTPLSQELYHTCAKDLPLIDFHNHLSVADLANNRQFENITELWVASDPYKHRAMRMCGIPEKYITGDASDFGKFADPLADKMLTTAAMLWFVENGQMPAWALLIVIVREFAVSGLRMIAADKGTVIAAGWSGKVKTASTMVCIVLMFLPIPAVVNTACVWIIALTTLYSGVEYFVKNKDAIQTM